MPDYRAPVAEMRFVLGTVADLPRIATFPAHEGVSELVEPVLDEAARFAGAVLAPLNPIGDRIGATLAGDAVTTPPGFQQAYQAYVAAGWNAVPFEPEHGGQGLPWSLAFAVQEMWQAANMAFGLCPLLTQGAVEALTRHGSPEQKKLYLEKLIAGSWTGTMNLTEPQAGSDLGAIRTKAVRDADGRFRLFGQKIYITYGEHDLTPNIIHMVLARVEGAPAGVKGISLFLAPKFLPDEKGEPGARNDLRCLSLEHKLGIHASPTAVMSFGDGEGAIAWLVGEENRGLEYMFTMMNNARLSVGLQGVAIAERAYQQALAYAQGRVQGRPMLPGGETIYYQPDVRRMLLHMRALTEAGRGLAYLAAGSIDIARNTDDPAEKAAAQARVELLTPLVKAWCTDNAIEVASLGIQVHGGMGFIEETGAAQYYRDARILPIYEGTNGIQANDLVFRKTLKDGGAAARALVAEMRAVAEECISHPSSRVMGEALANACTMLESAMDWLLTAEPIAAAAGASTYLTLFASTAGGFVLAKQALAAVDQLAAGQGNAEFLHAKLQTAEYFAAIMLPRTGALAMAVRATANLLEG